jgi:hypothetical protein
MLSALFFPRLSASRLFFSKTKAQLTGYSMTQLLYNHSLNSILMTTS